MAEAWRIAEPLGLPEPYEVIEIEHRTATILELGLAPVGDALQYRGVPAAGGRCREGAAARVLDRQRATPGRAAVVAGHARAGRTTSDWEHARLHIGDQVSVSGPYGRFVDDPAATAPALFLAAGSGLAPIRALLEAALAAGRRRSLSLIFSARTQAEVIDRERFNDWDAQHRGFRYERTLTRGPGPPPRGRIPTLLGSLFPELGDHDVFIAGTPGFVRDCAAAADALGARRASVYTEVFYADPWPWTEAPAETTEPR